MSQQFSGVSIFFSLFAYLLIYLLIYLLSYLILQLHWQVPFEGEYLYFTVNPLMPGGNKKVTHT